MYAMSLRNTTLRAPHRE